MPHLLWQRKNKIVDPFHRYLGGENRLFSEKIKSEEIQPAHPPICSSLRSARSLFVEVQMEEKFNAGIRIIPDQNLGFLQYVFYDKDGNEIELKEEIEM